MSRSSLVPSARVDSRLHGPFELLLEKVDACIVWFGQRECIHWHPVWWSIALALLALTTACPDYTHFQLYSGSAWAKEAMEWKFRHPLDAIPVARFAAKAAAAEAGIAEQLEKRSYRVAIPVLASALGATTTSLLVAQQFGSVLLLGLVLVQAQRITNDRLTALFFSIMFASSFVGQWGFVDFNNFDGLAWLTALLALFGCSLTGTACVTFIGGFTDERVILASPLLWLWYANAGRGTHSVERAGVLSLNGPRIGLLLGLAVFVIGRLWLGQRWGTLLNTSGVSFSVLKNNLLWLPLALVCTLKGALVLVFAAGWLVLFKSPTACLIGFFAWLPGLSAALLVYDLTRSLAYGFVAYLLVLRVVHSELDLVNLRRLAFCAALLCMVFPTYWILLRVHCVLPVLRLL